MKSPKKRESVDNSEKPTMLTARGRLKGALKDVMDNDEDGSSDELQTEEEKRMLPVRGRPPKKIKLDFGSGIPTNQSFIMKLFDRSVDLARYNDDSPLYPICRDWMINQPQVLKHNKKHKLVVPKREHNDDLVDMVRDKKIFDIATLPAPKPIEVSRIPDLLPIQLRVNKDNINLDYDLNNPSIAREELLTEHRNRWSQVRKCWNEQTKLCDERYKDSIEILGMIGMK